MTESQLPPVHVKKEKKRKIDTHSLGITKKKARMVLEEAPRQQPAMSNRPPRSVAFLHQLVVRKHFHAYIHSWRNCNGLK